MDVDLQYMTCGHLRLATTGQAVLENWKVQVHPLLDKYTLLAVVPLYSTTVDLKLNEDFNTWMKILCRSQTAWTSLWTKDVLVLLTSAPHSLPSFCVCLNYLDLLHRTQRLK